MRALVIAAALLAAAGCGEDTPTNPSDPPCATITIANNAVSPNAVTVSPGCQVTFVNNDSRQHEIASNPHPVHTDCPSTNALGTLSAGQTKLTNAYTAARSCGFHDHLNPDNAALQGTIVIQ